MSEVTDIKSETIVPNWAPKGALEDPVEMRLDALVTAEAAAVPMDLANGKRVWYKRVLNSSEQAIKIAYDAGRKTLLEVTPLTLAQAQELATQLNDNYRNYEVAFDGHVIPTQFIIGSSRDTEGKDRKDILVQVLQQAVDAFPHALLGRLNDMTVEEQTNFILQIKKLSLEELRRSTDPRMKNLADKLYEIQGALCKFYGAYIEGSLMGLIPDLKYFEKVNAEVGYLFSDNIGVTTNEKGDKKVVIYDFGYPRLDILPLESRQRLRDLINQKKRGEKPELPVLFIKEKRKYNDGFTGYITRMEIAPWYKEALGNELALGSSKKSGSQASYMSPTSYERFLDLVFEREMGVNMSNQPGDAEFKNPTVKTELKQPTDKLKIEDGKIKLGPENFYYELDVWRRLTGTPVYATTILHEYDDRGNFTEISRQSPEIYLHPS